LQLAAHLLHRPDKPSLKFCYDDIEPLSMNAEQASKLAVMLHQIGQDEMACEIDEALGRAKHYEAM
jgi:hypothetical protein